MPRSIALRKHMQGRRGFLTGGVNLYFSQAAYDAYLADSRPTGADKALAGAAVKSAADLTALGCTDAGGVNLSYTAKDGTLATKTSGTVPVVAFDRGATQNLLTSPRTLGTQTVTVLSGVTYTLSAYGTGSVTLSGGGSGTLSPASTTMRGQLTFTTSSTSLTLTVSGSITNANLNPGYATTYLDTTGLAPPCYTAGTPRSQNLLSKGDLTGDSYDGAGTTNTDNADGYRRITVSSSGTWKAWYRAAGPLLSQYSGCVYTTRIAIKAGNNTGAAISLWNGSAENILSAKIVSGPGNIASDSSRCYLTNLSPSTETVVQVSGVYGAPLIYVSSVPANSQTIGDYILFRQCALWEGTADLSYLDTTGLAYSEYPQLEIVHEIAATNYSKQQAASWTKRGTATVTDASDAQMGAYLQVRGLTGVGVNDTYQSISGLSGSANYEPSLWVRRITTSGVFNLAEPNASLGAWAIDCSKLPPYWVRVDRNHPAVTVSTEFTSTAGGLCGLHLYRNSGATAIDIDICHQLEAGRVSTAHIPTTSASVTRTATADAATMTTSSSAGMWIAEFVVNNAASATKQIIMKRGAAELYVQSGSVKVTDGTNTVTAGTAVTGVTNRVSVSWTGASLKASLNGAAVVSGSFTGTFGSGGTVYLGNDGAGASLQSGGLRKVANAPSAAANDTILQSAAAGGV